MDAVEGVAEIVEQVAGEVEKVADDIADHLPQGDLQKAARFVEKVANEAGKGAALADDLIEKVFNLYLIPSSNFLNFKFEGDRGYYNNIISLVVSTN